MSSQVLRMPERPTRLQRGKAIKEGTYTLGHVVAWAAVGSLLGLIVGLVVGVAAH